MTFEAKDLIPDDQEIVTARLNDTVIAALNRMREHEFSQLPVVDSENAPIGIITSDSILRRLQQFGASLEKLKVKDVSQDVSPYNTDDDIFEVLKYLRDHPAALIVNKKTRGLEGLVTPYDTTGYFRVQAEDMMLVEEIERSLDDHNTAAFTDENGLDKERQQAAIDVITNSPVVNSYKKFIGQYFSEADTSQKIDHALVERICEGLIGEYTYEKLTFDQKLNLLLRKDTWDSYGKHFSLESTELRKLLEAVRDIRNNIAHFRRDLTKTERQALRDCVEWLKRNPPVLPETTDDKVAEPSEAEVQEAIEQAEEKASTTPQRLESSSEVEDEDYAPLGTFLQAQMKKSEKIRLSFSQINTIVDEKLPSAAFNYRSWWSNDMSQPHVTAWIDAGWRASYVNMTNQTVEFARSKEEEKRYIAFFSDVLRHLRDSDFPLRKGVNPNGARWMYIATLPKDKPDQHADFRFYFASKDRFRVSLYIDSGGKDQNKEIFDRIYSQRDEVENELDLALSWERLDGKRASRIAIYRDGHINSDEESLEGLAKWAAECVSSFEDVVAPIAEKAIQAVIPQ